MNRIVMMVDGSSVTWRTTDGRTGSDPHMGPGKYGPTLVKVLTDLGIIGPWGTTGGWTIEVHWPDGSSVVMRGAGVTLMGDALDH